MRCVPPAEDHPPASENPTVTGSPSPSLQVLSFNLLARKISGATCSTSASPCGSAAYDVDDHVIGAAAPARDSDTAEPAISGRRTRRLSAKYFADDKNTVVVPSYTIYNVTAALRPPMLARNGVALRGFVQVRNVTDAKYVGSAFLNPDFNAAGEPMVYEPGAPRSVIVSLSLGHR
jgi:outer membrane receptor protein involved in Fe transport